MATVVAAIARQLPLVPEASSAEPIERGWATPAEVAKLLREAAGGRQHEVSALGHGWPLLSLPERSGLVAPGVPVVVGGEPSDGPDAAYRRGEGRSIERETLGRWETFVAADTPAPSFQLLAFGDSERILLDAGWIEIADLFSRLRVPATPAAVDRVLARGLRLGSDLVDRVSPGEAEAGETGRAEIAVGRAAGLVDLAAIGDPERVLGVHAGVESSTHAGATVTLVGPFGEATFDVEATSDGWRALRRAGAWPFALVRVATSPDRVLLAAEPAPEVNLLAPGMRTRLAFDLLSDLVTLAAS
jgi:hypothetical protein